jgi:hypothetical protein
MMEHKHQHLESIECDLIKHLFKNSKNILKVYSFYYYYCFHLKGPSMVKWTKFQNLNIVFFNINKKKSKHFKIFIMKLASILPLSFDELITTFSKALKK